MCITYLAFFTDCTFFVHEIIAFENKRLLGSWKKGLKAATNSLKSLSSTTRNGWLSSVKSSNLVIYVICWTCWQLFEGKWYYCFLPKQFNRIWCSGVTCWKRRSWTWLTWRRHRIWITWSTWRHSDRRVIGVQWHWRSNERVTKKFGFEFRSRQGRSG